jgi:DNA polymerase-3 subunit gamma/tau
LISDDVYGELLRLVAERDPQAVFPLVDRLVDAGADLGEFVAGAGEVLRAGLMANLGGKPEGLTEAMQVLIERYRSPGPAGTPLGLPAPDVVRLLGVLSDLEPQLRAGGTARLAVELLLLRWAMMSRTVELEEVIRALGRRPGKGDEGRKGEEGSGKGDASMVLRDAAPFPLPPSPALPPEKGPLTVDRLRALWPHVIADARVKSPMLGALLRVSEVAGVEGGTITLRLLDTNAVHAEGLERQRDALAQLVGRYGTEPVRIVLQGAGSGERPAPRPPRLTEEGARAERLEALRAKDPGLSAAVDALDLELLQ